MSLLSYFKLEDDPIWFPMPAGSANNGMKGQIIFDNKTPPAVFLEMKNGGSKLGFLVPMTAVGKLDLVDSRIKEMGPISVVVLQMILKHLVPNHVAKDVLWNYSIMDDTKKKKQVACMLNPVLALEKKEGSCWEKASILLAICRLNGIESRLVGNLQIPHFWVETRFAEGPWMPVDSYCFYSIEHLQTLEKIICLETSFSSLKLQKV